MNDNQVNDSAPQQDSSAEAKKKREIPGPPWGLIAIVCVVCAVLGAMNHTDSTEARNAITSQTAVVRVL